MKEKKERMKENWRRKGKIRKCGRRESKENGRKNENWRRKGKRRKCGSRTGKKMEARGRTGDEREREESVEEGTAKKKKERRRTGEERKEKQVWKKGQHTVKKLIGNSLCRLKNASLMIKNTISGLGIFFATHSVLIYIIDGQKIFQPI